MSDGREMIHYLLEDAFPAGSEEPVFHHGFLRAFENSLSFDANPIYTLLQEACYTQGFASDWSAERRDHFSRIFDISFSRLGCHRHSEPRRLLG